MIDEGFIPISRRLFKNRLWREERTYSRFEAWLFLIQKARYEDGIEEIKIYQKIQLKRGQLVGAFRGLASIWGWSTKKVGLFLIYLRNEGMITTETHKETGITIITLCKYNNYNDIKTREETAKDTAGKREGNAKETYNNKDDKDKQDREVKSTSRFSLPSVLDVQNYISQNSYSVNPEIFFNFYQSNGWMVGKNKMKDWKAAIRTWNTKERNNQTNGQLQQPIQTIKPRF